MAMTAGSAKVSTSASSLAVKARGSVRHIAIAANEDALATHRHADSRCATCAPRLRPNTALSRTLRPARLGAMPRPREIAQPAPSSAAGSRARPQPASNVDHEFDELGSRAGAWDV